MTCGPCALADAEDDSAAVARASVPSSGSRRQLRRVVCMTCDPFRPFASRERIAAEAAVESHPRFASPCPRGGSAGFPEGKWRDLPVHGGASGGPGAGDSPFSEPLARVYCQAMAFRRARQFGGRSTFGFDGIETPRSSLLVCRVFRVIR